MFLNKPGIFKIKVVNLQHDIRFTQFLVISACNEVVDETDSVDGTMPV
jgi:hypothetical protein